MVSSLSRAFAAAVAAFACVFAAAPAQAHPHVFVKMASELVYAPDGSVTGVRHAWTFDDMFSAYATQGLDQKEKGRFTREELAPLAEINVTSLKEYDFFTFAKADGRTALFDPPVDYWLDYTDEVLTLHYTLPLKKAVKAKALELEVYDPSYFVEFSFREKDPVALVGAPAQCKATMAKPPEAELNKARRLSEAFFDQLGAGTVDAQLANRISVVC